MTRSMSLRTPNNQLGCRCAKMGSMSIADDMKEARLDELNELIRDYETANNSRVLERVLAFIAPEASYWFSDGSHYGHAQIRDALKRTFDLIQDETYSIRDVTWIVAHDDVAVCRYRFSWVGVVNGSPRWGSGRGTNVFGRHENSWLIEHEQLTSDSA
jgi:ketosteroid isomerase-like protein